MSDLSDRAAALLEEAAEAETAFSEWLGLVLAEVLKRRGGWQILERSPQSWQAALTWQLIVRSAVLQFMDEIDMAGLEE
jgi:hypothetical protein